MLRRSVANPIASDARPPFNHGDLRPCPTAPRRRTLVAVTATSHRLSGRPTTQAAWWTFGLGCCALVVGPVLGFGLVGLFLALTTFVTAVSAFRQGELLWVVWLGAALAIAVVCYLPFMSTDYPYTNP